LSHVALTFGGDGAHLEIEDQHHGKSVPPVQVVNTVGAGDTFWVNTLADWALHPEGAADRVTASLTLVMKAAALNCTRQGCQPPSLAELENTGLEANAIKPLGALSTPRTWRSSPAR
jgi:fructokinase